MPNNQPFETNPQPARRRRRGEWRGGFHRRRSRMAMGRRGLRAAPRSGSGPTRQTHSSPTPTDCVPTASNDIPHRNPKMRGSWGPLFCEVRFCVDRFRAVSRAAAPQAPPLAKRKKRCVVCVGICGGDVSWDGRRGVGKVGNALPAPHDDEGQCVAKRT